MTSESFFNHQNDPLLNSAFLEGLDLDLTTLIIRQCRLVQATHKHLLRWLIKFSESLKEIKEVKLWNDYLVISELLGIAGNVSKDMDYVLPKFKTKSRMKAKGKRIKLSPAEFDKYFNK